MLKKEMGEKRFHSHRRLTSVNRLESRTRKQLRPVQRVHISNILFSNHYRPGTSCYTQRCLVITLLEPSRPTAKKSLLFGLCGLVGRSVASTFRVWALASQPDFFVCGILLLQRCFLRSVLRTAFINKRGLVSCIVSCRLVYKQRGAYRHV